MTINHFGRDWATSYLTILPDEAESAAGGAIKPRSGGFWDSETPTTPTRNKQPTPTRNGESGRAFRLAYEALRAAILRSNLSKRNTHTRTHRPGLNPCTETKKIYTSNSDTSGRVAEHEHRQRRRQQRHPTVTITVTVTKHRAPVRRMPRYHRGARCTCTETFRGSF